MIGLRLVIFLLGVVFLSNCSNLEQQKPVLVQKLGVIYSGKEANVLIYKTLSSATVEDAIFVKSSEEQKFASHIYERQDTLIYAKIVDSALLLVMGDTDARSSVTIDTVLIPLVEIFDK